MTAHKTWRAIKHRRFTLIEQVITEQEFRHGYLNGRRAAWRGMMPSFEEYSNLDRKSTYGIGWVAGYRRESLNFRAVPWG